MNQSSPTLAARARIPLPGLTGIRGVGAIWVLIYHAAPGYSMHLPLAEAGYLGVDLFFILSGFVLSHAHPDVQWDWPRYKAFIRTRFARIFPMHWVALALVVAVVVIYQKVYAHTPEQFAWQDLISNALLVQNWGLGRPASWNTPAWSLSTEWLASLLFPLFLLATRRVMQPMKAALLCASSLGAYAVFLALIHHPTPDADTTLGSIARTMCEFAAGCFLYRVYARGASANWAWAFAAATLIFAGIFEPTWAMLGRCILGMIKKCTGAHGWMSWKA